MQQKRDRSDQLKIAQWTVFNIHFCLTSQQRLAHTLYDLAGVEMFLKLRSRALEMLQAPRYFNLALALHLCGMNPHATSWLCMLRLRHSPLNPDNKH